MATKKPTTQSRLSALQALLDGADETTLANDPLVAIQRERLERQRAADEERARAARFSDVSSSVSSTEEFAQPRGFLGSVVDGVTGFIGSTIDAAQGGGQRSLAGGLYTASDVEDTNPLKNAAASVAAPIGALYDALTYQEGTPLELTNLTSRYTDPSEAMRRDSRELAKASERNLKDVEVTRQAIKDRGFLVSELGEAVLDVAESPTSALSLIGGPLAGAALADVYGVEYMQAREKGLSKEDAQISASMQAAPEAIGFIPAGKLLSRVPGLSGISKVAGDKLASAMARTVARAGVTAVGEGVGEVATTAAQLGMHQINAEYGSDEMKKYAAGELPKTSAELGSQLWRSFKAGAATGAVFGGVEGRMEAAADAGRLVTEFNTAMDDVILENRNAEVNARRAEQARAAAATTPAPVETQAELFPTAQSDGRTFAEQEAERQASYERTALERQQRRREFDAAQNERAIQEDAQREDMFRQMELDRAAAENPTSALAQGLARVGAQLPRSTDATVLPDGNGIDSGATQPAVAPVQGELDVTTEQPIDIARREVETAIKKQEDKALNSLKTKRATDRRKFREQQLKDTASLPIEQRTSEVAQRMLDWDRDNPVPTRESVANVPATPAPVKADVPADRAAVYEQIEQRPDVDMETQIREEVEALKQFYPNATEGQLREQIAKDTGRIVPLESKPRPVRQTGTTLEDVRKAVGEGIGSNYNANVIASAVGNQRIKLIDNDASLPEGAPVGGAAFYDGKNIIIDVRAIDKNNIRGDLLTYMAHEGKHAADFSGNNAAGIESFIGFENNKKLNQMIRDRAAKGDPVAREAVENAERAVKGDVALATTEIGEQAAGNMTDTILAVELPAYYINAVRASGDRGLIGALQRQIVSPIRVKAKRAWGIDNVNLDDVFYMSEQLVRQVADGTQSFEGDLNQDPLAMIYNESSAGFDQAQAEGRTYTSADGKRKYVLSDADSTMKPNGYQRLREATDPIPLGDLLDHPVLYREHPDAANIPIVAVDTLPGSAFAQWHGDTGEIYVAKDKMRRVSPRVSIMHELQHYVQQEGGQSPNFFNDATDPSGFTATQQTYQKALADNDRMARLVLDRASQLRKAVDDTAEFDSILYDFNKPDWQKAAQLTKMVDSSKLDDASVSTINRYNESREAANALVGPMNEAADSKLAAYHRNITEREAFYTQDNVDTPQSELPINPEESAMRTDRMSPSRPDVELTEGKIDVPYVLASRPASEAVGVTPASGTKGLDHKVWDAVKGMVSYHGGLGKKFDDMIQNSVGEAAHYASTAQRNMVDIDRGLNALAEKMKGRDGLKTKADALAVVKQATFQRMQALEKINDPQRRESALAAWVRDTPELRPIARMYSDITQMSNSLADQLAASTTTLTKSDREFIQKIRDSGYGYMTRIYQTQTGKGGRKLARDFLKQAAKAQTKMEQGKTLTEKQREAALVYVDAADYLMGKIRIPSIDDMQGMKQNKLNDLFNTWTPNDVDKWTKDAMESALASGLDERAAKAHVKDSMIQVLDGARDLVTPENLNAKAAAIIQELLGVSGRPGRIAQQVGGLRQDRGILQKREEMHPSIERLMGRVTTEPSVVLANTLAKQGELLARTKLLMGLRDTGMIVTKDVAGTAGNEKFSHQLSGETAGPLNGLYTTPQVANVINSTMEIYSSATDAMTAAFVDSAAAGDALGRKTLDLVSKGAGIAKLSSIVLDAYNLGMNTVGSPMMLAMNGVVSPTTAFRAATAGKDSVMNVFREGGAKFNALLEDGIKYQVVDSARAQELRRSTHEALKERVLEGTPIVTPVGRALGKFKNTAVEAFSMSDAWVKLAAFEDRVNFLTEFYKNEGIERSADDIKTEAGNTVRDTNITFGKTPPFLRIGEKYGISTFMPYFYNVPRMIVKSTMQGYSDIVMGVQATNPKAKQAAITKGVMRLAGNAAATAGMVYATKAIAAAINGDDDEKAEEMKKMLRDDARFADPIYLGKNKDGIPLFFRTSRIDPMGPVTDIIRTAMNDSIDNDEKIDILGKQVSGMLFMNRFVAAAVGTATGKDPTKAPMRIERVPVLQEASGLFLDTFGNNRVTKGTLASIDSLLPGFVDAFDPNNPSLADGSEAGDFADVLAMVTRVSGGRVDKADPAAVLRDMAFEIKEVKDSARLTVADQIRRGVDPKTTARYITTKNRDLYDKMSRMTDVYEGMVNGNDMSPTAAMAALKEYGSLDSVQIANVRKGLPKDDLELSNKLGGILSARSLAAMGKRLERGGGSESREDYDRRSKATLEELRNYGLKAGD